MVIIVTDTGKYWNHNTPILQKYSDIVKVVCINGKKVTDKYECIVSPYKEENIDVSNDSRINKYNSLQSIANEIRAVVGYHENVLFLTDSEPMSLFPYLMIKDAIPYSSMHIWCMSPYSKSYDKIKEDYFSLLYDLSKIDSLLYVDSNEILEKLDYNLSSEEIDDYFIKLCNDLLPNIIYQIEKKIRLSSNKHYYDFGVNRYIPTKTSYERILKMTPLKEDEFNTFNPFRLYATLGRIVIRKYPTDDVNVKSAIVDAQPRLDGKYICEKLKNMRIELAKANNIKYKPTDCPSIGPCAGTCVQCDIELKYIQKQLDKIPADKRTYPDMDISDLKLHSISEVTGNE